MLPSLSSKVFVGMSLLLIVFNQISCDVPPPKLMIVGEHFAGTGTPPELINIEDSFGGTGTPPKEIDPKKFIINAFSPKRLGPRPTCPNEYLVHYGGCKGELQQCSTCLVIAEKKCRAAAKEKRIDDSICAKCTVSVNRGCNSIKYMCSSNEECQRIGLLCVNNECIEA